MTKLRKYTSVNILYYQNNTTMSKLHDAKATYYHICFIDVQLHFRNAFLHERCNVLDCHIS